MKITDITRKLKVALIAGGLLAPSTLFAADLNTNLVVNAGFETVDLNSVSYYNAPQILNWGGIIPGFAYSHDLSGEQVPDFANGDPLVGGGHWYFSPGNGGNNSLANALTQDIDVSTGPTAEAIAGGSGEFSISVFFNTFEDQADRGFVRADFLGDMDKALGNALVSTPVSPALAEWTKFSATGMVPAGTRKVHLSSWGEIFVGSGGSADGYTDNIDFRILGEAAELDGDYNDNGMVDAADYVAWRDKLGQSVTLPNDPTPGTVDDTDYTVWRMNFGTDAAALGVAAGVPEPTSLMLAAGAVAVPFCRRTKRGKLSRPSS
jgi:hypothetical protein